MVRWIAQPEKLAKEQVRVIRNAVRHGEQLALSAITLLEIAVLRGMPSRSSVTELLGAITTDNGFIIIPIDLDIAAEVAAMGDSLRDPADRVIVATARVRRLRLVTSDQRIIDSQLVATVA